MQWPRLKKTAPARFPKNHTGRMENNHDPRIMGSTHVPGCKSHDTLRGDTHGVQNISKTSFLHRSSCVHYPVQDRVRSIR